MSSERQVYVLYSVEFISRILLPKFFGQCGNQVKRYEYACESYVCKNAGKICNKVLV
jgi:hypothetical protein